MNDLPDTLNRLAAHLETLELRVYALEHPAEVPRPALKLETAPAQTMHPGEVPSLSPAGGMFSLLGRAMLGIAGAYVLRAVAESSSLPRLSVAAVAIAYAMLWLVWAVRVPVGAWWSSIIYASTSALILTPMLWELTLRFKVLPAAGAAALLAAFVCVAYALAWKRNIAAVLWVYNIGAVLVALALLVATREMIPFIATLLLMVLLCEYAEVRHRRLGVRPLVAVAADIALWALFFIYTSPQSERPDYPFVSTAALLAPAIALFLIVAASAAIRTAVLRETITIFEIIQTVIAFLLVAASLVAFVPSDGAVILGASCLVLSASTYALVFALFARSPERRNFRVFATWSAALFLFGSILCIPSPWLAPFLGVSALVATALGVRFNRLSLALHGTIYLLAAAVASGLPAFVFQALAGALPAAPPWAVAQVAVCAILCYAVRRTCTSEAWKQQLLQFVFASVAIGAIAALLVEGLVRLIAFGVSPEAHHLALIRTFAICAIVLALAFSGARWRRMELTRIGYFALALVAAKLIFEDLSHGHLAFIAASIFLFAVTLIAVPRVARTMKSN